MHYCRCIPWDYPFSDQALNKSKQIGICDYLGSSCFNSFLENGMASSCQEKCDPGCNEIKYTTTLREEQINWQSICAYDPEDTTNILDLFEIKTFEYLFNSTEAGKNGVFHFQKALVGANDTNSFMYEYCKEKLMNDIAIVEVVMESPTVMKYIQGYKASSTDKMANFGMSLISLWV